MATIIGFTSAPSAQQAVPVQGYSLVASYPHDRDAFTQGLQIIDGAFFEGTGLNGRSSIRKVEIATGRVLQKRDVPQQFFGEGITILKGELFQLTYQSGVGFVYDAKTFEPRRSWQYRGEGWGLTTDGANLYMSDGSEFIRVLEPATLAEKRRIRVTANGTAVRNLNELEFVKREIYANIWQTDRVARIDPATGKVTAFIDFRGLLTPREAATVDVLNGIAYDPSGDRLFVTGKLWPKVFQVKVKN